MAGEVFGAGLDAQVGAACVRREEQRRRPGVVEDDAGAVRVGHRGDGRDVLDLEALRARRLDEHRPGVRPEQVRDVAGHDGVVEGGLDAEALQHLVAELARRP